MQEFRVCFTGIGSIAKRHIRNLIIICEERGLNLSIDAYRHSEEAENVAGINNTYFSIDQVPDNYDVVFITNPTDMHLDTLELFHNKAKHFFIEKPVVSPQQIRRAKQFSLREDTVYYVACPLRYNSVIQYIKSNIMPESVISVRSISSSYLPDWRPGQDYRNTYSAHKALGGGVSVDLIHEWDYLTYLFGWPKVVYSIRAKKSLLDIDSDDLAVYIAESDEQIIELHLDYFGRKTTRKIEMFTNDDVIIGDITNHNLQYLREGRTVDLIEERDDFQRKELSYFIDMVVGMAKRENGFEHSIKVLELTQGIIK